MKSMTLHKIQKLVVDILKVERHHSIPGTTRKENVGEHSYSVALLCWKLFQEINPPLDLTRIFKYALAHDFSERGLNKDINTFASIKERVSKEEREAIELKKISREFDDFDDLVNVLKNYGKVDEEALFVWTVDKMQAIILGEIDQWRPYQSFGVTYEQFQKKCNEVSQKSSPHLKEVFKSVYKNACRTYYDNPKKVKITLK